MKAKKLAAFLAAALAVTSLNVAAFATGDPAGNETDDVSESCQFMLKLQSEDPNDSTSKAADTSDSSDSSSSGDPEDPEDGPVVEMSTEKVFGAWESYEFTHDVVEGDVIAITYKDKLANGPNDYSCILLQCNVSDTLYTANVQGDLAVAAGTFKYTITAADVTTINGTKIRVNGNMITITNITINPEDDPEDTSATDATTAAPGNDPGYVVITPDDTTAATTEAPEVVTGANGESVEAAKDVVPAGATLEAKEQTKEEAVKAVEAVKATDANKEVVETVKKAIEDAKAAVMDINLVKDGVKVQPNGTIKVTVKVPEALKSAANLFVYRVEADGTFTDVKATVKDGKIEFTTSHFSTYIITSEALTGDAVVTEAAATTEPAATTADGNTTTDDKNQATGVVLAVIPAMLAAAGVIAAKKRK